MNKIKSFYEDIPLPVRLFLGKALLVFIIWKLIYSLFLFDSKILDNPLTTFVGNSSALVLNNIGVMSGFTSERVLVEEISGVIVESSEIYHNDKLVLYIADACNGLELIVLYIGFIICMPSKFWRKVKYIIIGIFIISLVNILRCCGLIYLTEYYNKYFDFAHHYIFKIIVYATTFLMWIVYSRKIKLKNESV